MSGFSKIEKLLFCVYEHIARHIRGKTEDLKLYVHENF